jgi:hypothetical protein
MIFHHTKSKGDLGVLKVKLDLYQQGFLILVPETEHAPFDLVIFRNGVYKSVQVKYRNLNRRGALEIPFRSSYSTSKGVKTKEVNKSFVDLYAIYCPEIDQCFYFDPKSYNKSICLRVKASLNNQFAKVNDAQWFRKVP